LSTVESGTVAAVSVEVLVEDLQPISVMLITETKRRKDFIMVVCLFENLSLGLFKGAKIANLGKVNA
jgi:hypothetical protein